MVHVHVPMWSHGPTETTLALWIVQGYNGTAEERSACSAHRRAHGANSGVATAKSGTRTARSRGGGRGRHARRIRNPRHVVRACESLPALPTNAAAPPATRSPAVPPTATTARTGARPFNRAPQPAIFPGSSDAATYVLVRPAGFLYSSRASTDQRS